MFKWMKVQFLFVLFIVAGGPGVSHAADPLSFYRLLVFEGEWRCEEEELLAKAKFEAMQANPAKLAQARVEALRRVWAAAIRDFLSGRATPANLTEVLLRLQQSELAVLGKDADRVPVFENVWGIADTVEEISAGKHAAGRLSVADYLGARADRLDAEIQLAQARNRQPKPLRPARGRPEVSPLMNIGAIAPNEDLLDEHMNRARRKFEASQAAPQELALAKLIASRVILRERSKEFQAGQGILDSLLAAITRYVEAELATLKDGDPTPLYERAWEYARAFEAILWKKQLDGRASLADYMTARLVRLKAEIQWAKVRAGQKQPRRRLVASDPLALADTWEEPLDYFKETAKSKFAASQVEPKELAKQCVEAARTIQADSFQNPLTSRLVYAMRDPILQASQTWLEAELAALDKDADASILFERAWEVVMEEEAMYKARYNAGRNPITDYLAVQSVRQELETRWAQARAKHKQP